ncbi:2-polyprenyl-6-methoxyphenol hydroxylase-like FAD-dependent oxidoreductase [Paraburkholderia sp. EB58]|jgi:2-polyprenyl-6-methoxyphenol hydroxylase-like FAD-dependent oxidoreductase|uniref:FAD binding domain-containing protein n=1 Tax=Paraburkholderia sp. EB58 TaxID=3035125 RepID=UPI003D192B8F
MTTSVKPRAVIVGGSLSGLFTATTLRQAGWDVDVFELSPSDLDSRGGGIVLQPDVLAAFRFARIGLPERLGVDSGDRIYLDRDDNLIEQFYMPQTQTSWNLLYTTMKQALPAESLHAGEMFTGFEVEGEQIVARFSSGRVERAHLLIGADGARSSVRRVVLPEVAPSYAGYVAWRGLVPENALPPGAADILRDRFTFQQDSGHSALAYLVPGEDGSTAVGERRWNWVWYRRQSADELAQLLVDRDGTQRTFSLPPGALKDADIAALRAASGELLAPAFQSLVASTQEPFVQAIQDLRVPQMVFGKVILLGDAAFVPRPHTAGSTAKAAANALALASTLTSTQHDGAHLDAALARWQRVQLQLGNRMTDLGVALGDRLMNL